MISTLLTHYEHRYSLLKLQSQSSADVKNAQVSFITRLRPCWQLWLPWERRGTALVPTGLWILASIWPRRWQDLRHCKEQKYHVNVDKGARRNPSSCCWMLEVRSLKHEASPPDNTPSITFLSFLGHSHQCHSRSYCYGFGGGVNPLKP